MRTFVISDIHGQLTKLKEVFQKAEFDMENDLLICLGDCCDRGPDSKGVMDLISQVKNLKLAIGNHDMWCIEWMMFKHVSETWYGQGGQQTIDSFKCVDNFEKYIHFYMNARAYYLDDKNRFFAHSSYPLYLNDDLHEFMWDRTIARGIISNKFIDCPYSEVYLGHTVVGNKPINKNKYWLVDTGAGFGGRLTMINIDTKEIFKSSGLLHD